MFPLSSPAAPCRDSFSPEYAPSIMDPRLVYAPPRHAFDLRPSEQQQDHITTLDRPRGIPPFALSEYLLVGCPRLTPPPGPPHRYFQRVRRLAFSAQGSPQVISDSFYEYSYVGSRIPAQAVTISNDGDFAELLSFLNNSSDNPKLQPSKASDSPYTASPAPTLAQLLATPTTGPSPLDGPVCSASHHPAPDVASSAPLRIDFNESPFLVNDGDNAVLVASPAKQRADPATRSVSPIKSKRPATSRIRSTVTPRRPEASRSVRGVASPLSVEVLPTSTEPSPAETVYYPDPRPRMWDRSPSGDESTAQSPASSPAKEVLTPTFRTSPPKTLICPHDGCASMFARAHDLRRHANIHTGVFTFHLPRLQERVQPIRRSAEALETGSRLRGRAHGSGRTRV